MRVVDPLLIARLADLVVLVVSELGATREVVYEMIERLRCSQTPLAGILMAQLSGRIPEEFVYSGYASRCKDITWPPSSDQDAETARTRKRTLRLLLGLVGTVVVVSALAASATLLGDPRQDAAYATADPDEGTPKATDAVALHREQPKEAATSALSSAGASVLAAAAEPALLKPSPSEGKPAPAEADPAASAPEKPAPAAGSIDLDTLLARGDEYFRLGDLQSARAFYQLAARQGSAWRRPGLPIPTTLSSSGTAWRLDLDEDSAIPRWASFFAKWGVRHLAGNGDEGIKVADETVLVSGRTAGEALRADGRWGEKSRYLHDTSGGTLKLRAYPLAEEMRPEFWGFPYVASMISAALAPGQLYGYWEIRARINAIGKGQHLAFWLLPDDASWPPEVDIFEIVGTNSKQFTANIHPLDEKTSLSMTFYPEPPSLDSFHVFGFEWTLTMMRWTVDGKVVREHQNHFSDKRLYPLISWEIGSNWPGKPDASTPWPPRSRSTTSGSTGKANLIIINKKTYTWIGYYERQ